MGSLHPVFRKCSEERDIRTGGTPCTRPLSFVTRCCTYRSVHFACACCDLILLGPVSPHFRFRGGPHQDNAHTLSFVIPLSNQASSPLRPAILRTRASAR